MDSQPNASLTSPRPSASAESHPSRPGDHPTSPPSPKTNPSASADSRPLVSAGGRTSYDQKPRNPRILIFRSADKELSSLSPFQRKDGCDRFGSVVRCDRMRDGALEVEFRKSEEAAKALHATRFVFSEGRASGRRLVSISLTVEPHRSKNSTRGVINCFDLRGVSDEEIADGLSEYGVTAARRILTKRGTVRTNNIILTFDSTDMPSEVRVGYVNIRVRPYVPAPMRCYRCQRFGHTKDNCRGKPTCSKCASQDHADEDCDSETPRCVNCGEGQTPHSAYDRSCPTYVKEKEINTIKATKNLSFKEAREVYNQTHPKTSYAQKVRVTNSTDASQMSVAQLVQLLKRFGLTVVATGDSADSPAPRAPPSDTEQAAQPSVWGPPSPAPASSGEGDGWTVVQRRQGGRRPPAPGKAPPTPPRPRPPTAVQEALRRGEEERRAREARRARIAQKALEAKEASGADSASAGANAASAADTPVTPQAGTRPIMGPPPPPPPSQRRPPPSLPGTPVSRTQTAAPTSPSGQQQPSAAPGRLAKRQTPPSWSPSEGDAPRAKKPLPDSGHGRSASAEGRLHREGSGHPRIHYGRSASSDTEDLV